MRVGPLLFKRGLPYRAFIPSTYSATAYMDYVVSFFFAVFLTGFFSGSGALSNFAPQSMQKITQFTDFTRLCSHPI